MVQTMLRDYLQHTEDALSSGRINEALTHCQYILNYFPGSLEARRLLGEVYLAQGQLEEAQQAFDWILTSDPENVVVYCDCALISERRSDFDTALDCYQQAYELSRGNSQIRQVFNSLSAKLGQPGFMFSRAGLARLYMRGDLLMQAIQEWEIVLASTPGRPDVRTGLLEAFWREGKYDRVEQLAQQILQEFPACLKALLLLAHTTSMHHMHAAQALIQRAEVLDPELVMAQELFSDLLALQPDAPFLALLKRSPIAFPEVLSNQPAMLVETHATNGTQNVNTGPLSGWSDLDAAIESQKDYQEMPAYATWSGSESEQSNSTEFKEADLPVPPPWLEMLTNHQTITPSAAIELEPPLSPPAQPLIEPAASAREVPLVPQEQIPDAAPISALEDTGGKGWPDWLKSLGAPPLDLSPQPDAAAIMPEPQQEYTSTSQVTEPVFEQMTPAAWSSQPTTPLPPTEEQVITTLENLEQSLYAQGFAPLEPGTLSTIAQGVQEPTLSSALAQFGDLLPPPIQPRKPIDYTPPVAQPPAPVEPIQPRKPIDYAPPLVQPPAPVEPTQPSWSVEPGPVSNLSPEVSNEILREPVHDVWFEDELEVTMKLPTIRPRPMQQLPKSIAEIVIEPFREPPLSAAPEVSNKPASKPLTTNALAEDSSQAQEGLLKGYHYQVAGNYDKALQEYRTIIRSTPELLAEVINNVHALLKLTPQYSPAYRVLGDAYMSQGEYLQAMEAYNQALSISKKSR